jgi:FAD/FMN-containing dehydrogenase
VLDFTRHMGKILEIDPERRIARVQPGVVLDHLRNAAEKHHLTFAPDPASHDRCTIGGMIGNNSCGVHSIMGGKTDDNIEALEVVTYDGTRLGVGADALVAMPGVPSSRADRAAQIRTVLKEIADQYGHLIRQKFPNIPRRVSGYNLNYLLPENGFHIARALVGSEGTCATTLEATCRLIESPPQRVLLVVAYPDIYQCADHIPEILEYKPIGLEGFDDLLVYYERTKGINPEGLTLLPEGGGWLLVEFGAESLPGAELQAQRLIDALRRSPNPPNVKLFSGAQAKRVWEVRESSLGATSHVPGEPLNWEGWEDAAVSPEKLGGYLRELRKMMADFGYKGSLY